MPIQKSSEARASHGDGLPRWDGSKLQYTQRIGYCFDIAKKRIRKSWNLGKDYLEACERAIPLRKAWDTIIVRQIWPTFHVQAQRLLPEYDWSKPVWLEDWMLVKGVEVRDALFDKVRQAQGELATVGQEVTLVSEKIAANRLQSATELDPESISKHLAKKGLFAVPSDSPFGSLAHVEEISIAEAKDRYLLQEKARIGRGGGKGLKPRSYNAKSKNLRLVLGLTTAKDKPRVVGRTPIDTVRTIRSILKSDLQAIVDFWMDLPDGVDSTRTAMNYLREFHTFLRWCEGEENLGFVRPKGTDELFHFSFPKTKKAVNYDPGLLRGVLNGGSEKSKLYQLLAANGGLYQQDISDLQERDLIVHNDHPCLWWLRSKETLVEGEETTFRVLTPLWKETYDLLLKFRAPKGNPHSRLLLNAAGKPLVQTKVDKQTSNAVTKAFDGSWDNYFAELSTPPLKKFTFKQFRKIGWNIIKRLDNKFAANLWAGQRISGIDFDYDDAQPEDYDAIFPIVEKYRQKLIEDKVLP